MWNDFIFRYIYYIKHNFFNYSERYCSARVRVDIKCRLYLYYKYKRNIALLCAGKKIKLNPHSGVTTSEC